MYHALPDHSLPRLLADTLGEEVIMSADGYVSILKLLVNKYKMYLEVAVDAFFFTGGREQTEIYASYVARRELVLMELSAQLRTPLDERLAGYLLMRGANLAPHHRELIQLRKPGTMP